MKLVVGLGNPGTRYERTRHNLGFRVIDTLAGRWQIDATRQKFSAWVGFGTIANEQVILFKPATFMNLSGQAVQAAMAFYKLTPERLLVVMDDLDLPVGRIRVRSSGSSGGHRGLENIVQMLGSEAIARVRIGIGGPGRDAVDHVLSVFSPEDEAVVDAAIGRAADAVESWLTAGVATTMNKFNRSERPGDGGASEKSDEGV